MFDTFLQSFLEKIKEFNKLHLILGGITIVLLIIYVIRKYKSKNNSQPTPTEGEECFNGMCQIPPHLKETISLEEQHPMPVEPVLTPENVQSQELNQVNNLDEVEVSKEELQEQEVETNVVNNNEEDTNTEN